MTTEPNVFYNGIFTWLLRPLATGLTELPIKTAWYSQALDPQSLRTQQKFNPQIYSNCINAIPHFDRAEDRKPLEDAWYLRTVYQQATSMCFCGLRKPYFIHIVSTISTWGHRVFSRKELIPLSFDYTFSISSLRLLGRDSILCHAKLSASK